MPGDHIPKASIGRVSEQAKLNVTVFGDGQLARMMQPAAAELDIHLRILASRPDASAAQVVPDVIIGDYHDYATLRGVAAGSDAVTFEHEHVPNEHSRALIAAGFNVQPQPAALINAQDKLIMRQHLQELGAPIPPFQAIGSAEEATSFWAKTGGQVCLKARRDGYDGKGVWFPESESELVALTTQLLKKNTPLMAEKRVALTRELSVLVARRPSGETKEWPITQSVQRNGVCAEAMAPAPNLAPELEQRARALGADIAQSLGVTGVLAVELFAFSGENGEEDIAVNELAMRPHNTGHWTQDGSITSQFEQHLRAVLDLPLGATEETAPITVMANVLGAPEDPQMPMRERVREVMQRYPQVKIHLYGKAHRPGRKIGHVNLCGSDSERTRQQARAAAHFLVHAKWPESGLEK